MDAPKHRAAITRTTPTGRTLSLDAAADREARVELRRGLNGAPLPSMRWRRMAAGTLKTAGVETALMADALRAGREERALRAGFVRATIRRFNAAVAWVRAERAAGTTPPAPTPHPMRRRTDKRAA